jgi:hypothetical protein
MRMKRVADLNDLFFNPHPDLEFGPCFLAYFDILGWSDLIRSKRGTDVADKIIGAIFQLKYARQLLSEGQEMAAGGIVEFGGTLRASFFSDSMLYSCAAEANEAARLTDRVNLMCRWLLSEGLYTRGAMVVGDLHHESDGTVIGRALIEAHEIERDVAKYPRLIVTNAASSLLASAGDRAQTLGPFVRTDADGLAYLDIFSHMGREALLVAQNLVERDLRRTEDKDIFRNPAMALKHRAKYGWVRSRVEHALAQAKSPAT